MIAIVDFGVGNLGSIQNMVRLTNVESVVTSDPLVLARATKIILPGVGAFDTAMERINTLGIRSVLTERALKGKTPLLGICLGMQILFEKSEEGQREGLGWIPGRVASFQSLGVTGLHVPHMGWSQVLPAKADPILVGIAPHLRFYFAHSFYAMAHEENDVLFYAEHGVRFHAGIARGNIYGVQFHPEKSHAFGKGLIQNFLNL